VSGVSLINEFDNELLLDQDETIILNKSIRSAQRRVKGQQETSEERQRVQDQKMMGMELKK